MRPIDCKRLCSRSSCAEEAIADWSSRRDLGVGQRGASGVDEASKLVSNWHRHVPVPRIEPVVCALIQLGSLFAAGYLRTILRHNCRLVRRRKQPFAMSTADKIALLAALFAALSLVVSWLAYKASQSQSTRSLKRDQAASEMEMFSLWDDVRLVHQTHPITPQVGKAHKALAATSRRWIDDVEQRTVIAKNFRSDYIALYESFRDATGVLPGIGKRPREFLTEDMDIAYGEMTSMKE